jgi:hypothetical protein
MSTPAFPTGLITDDKGVIVGGSNGMTLRDYFAAKALHFCLKNCFTTEGAVEDAYEIADAMLEARK